MHEAELPSADLRIGIWRDPRLCWNGHILRMDDDRLVRKVLLNCVKPEKESLYGEIPSRSVEKAIETVRDRENWKKLRPS